MTLTVNQQTALEARSVPIVYFVKLDFSSGTLYYSNCNRTYTWGGFDWIGLGQLGSISEIKSSESTDPNAITMNLNIANASLLAVSIGAVEEYRGRDAVIYMCPLDEQFNLIDTPIKAWEGVMDVMSVSANADNSAIALRCEPSAKNLRRRVPLRVNSAQQQAKYPDDQGFKYQIDLIANPQVWVSREFQKQLGGA